MSAKLRVFVDELTMLIAQHCLQLFEIQPIEIGNRIVRAIHCNNDICFSHIVKHSDAAAPC